MLVLSPFQNPEASSDVSPNNNETLQPEEKENVRHTKKLHIYLIIYQFFYLFKYFFIQMFIPLFICDRESENMH